MALLRSSRTTGDKSSGKQLILLTPRPAKRHMLPVQTLRREGGGGGEEQGVDEEGGERRGFHGAMTENRATIRRTQQTICSRMIEFAAT